MTGMQRLYRVFVNVAFPPTAFVVLSLALIPVTSFGQVPTCATLFKDAESIPALLEQAKFVANELPTTATAVASRLKLIDQMGAKDALALFGSDFNSWPLYLGASPGGHVILALGKRSGEISILSYKRLEISSEEYQRRRDLDFEIALGKVPTPLGYETIRAWLERTEDGFNQTIAKISSASKLWLIRDSNYEHLDHAVLIHADVFGNFEQPWLLRSTYSATPDASGKSARMSEPEEITPLIEALLQMKTGK